MKPRLTPHSERSWSTYAAELKPARAPRGFVLVTGALLGSLGVPLLLGLDVSFAVKFFALLGWVGLNGRVLRRQQHAYRRIERLRVDASGRVIGHGLNGERYRLRVASGSRVLGSVAWLRLRFADSSVYGELFWRGEVETQAWRRLQVIWRWGE